MLFFKCCWISIFCHVALQNVVLASIQSDCLEQHNLHRGQHDTPAVTYSSVLEEQAQRLANFMAQVESELEYTGRSANVDENLYHAISKLPLTISDAVEKWYGGRKFYNYNQPNPSAENENFIKLVWRSYKSIGCGYAVTKRKDGGVNTYVVALYTPPAKPNSDAEYVLNVRASKPKE